MHLVISEQLLFEPFESDRAYSTSLVETANKLNAPTRIDKRQLSFRSCIGVLLRCIPRAPPVNLRVTTELSNRALSFVLPRPFTDRERSMISHDRRVFALTNDSSREL